MRPLAPGSRSGAETSPSRTPGGLDPAPCNVEAHAAVKGSWRVLAGLAVELVAARPPRQAQAQYGPQAEAGFQLAGSGPECLTWMTSWGPGLTPQKQPPPPEIVA